MKICIAGRFLRLQSIEIRKIKQEIFKDKNKCIGKVAPVMSCRQNLPRLTDKRSIKYVLYTQVKIDVTRDRRGKKALHYRMTEILK